MKKILVIGQIPPPYGGQALMIKRMLDGVYKNTCLHHVKMTFSKDMDEMGRLGIYKLFHPFSILTRTIYLKFRYNIQILYYPPSGPKILPMLRDVFLLLCVRWMFKKTIFHFHAAGLSELYPKLSWPLKLMFQKAYFEPDIAIQLSDHNPKDGSFLRAKKTLIIPNGIEDDYINTTKLKINSDNNVCNVLFVGMISESKGVLILINAIKICIDLGVKVKVRVVGKFSSEIFKNILLNKIFDYQLSEFIEFTGVLTGQAKHEQYLTADIFCFPTYFECESFGLVAVEAMQFGVPVILSSWRGVQSLIVDGEEGFLVPAKDAEAVAKKISLLAHDPALRKTMGEKGRKRYLLEFTTDKFYQRMNECFEKI